MTIHKPNKVDLGFFPTPLVKLENLTRALDGPEILMKRDDLTGLALGGNKTRKLEFILRDALDQGCDTIISAGAAQSNHCRQTAAAAAQLQLECHLILGGYAPDEINGNLLLDDLLGAHIHWAGDKRKGEDIPALAKSLESEGKKPYVVPYGGSNELGAYGFANALVELESQTDTSAISHIVFASSSGGTHAGLMVGKALVNRDYHLIGINIDKDESANMTFEQVIVNLANSTSRLINANSEFTLDQLILNDHYLGDGYGEVGELEKEAITLLAQQEGILTDPVYTGRAMGGMIDMIRTGQLDKDDKVLFWHTGGAPAIFAYADNLK